MDAYMSALFNMSSNRKFQRGVLNIRSIDSNGIQDTGVYHVDAVNEAAIRRVVQRINEGHFSHLPPIKELKMMFNHPEYKDLLQRSFQRFELSQLSIDEVTARILSLIIQSPVCCCTHLKLQRCAFTETGRRIFFSALTMVMSTRMQSSKGTKKRLLYSKSFQESSNKRVGIDEPQYAQTTNSYCLAAGEDVFSSSSSQPLMMNRGRQESGNSFQGSEFNPNGCSGIENGDSQTGLQSIVFTEMGLNDNLCMWLGEVLEQQPHLRTLCLSYNRIGPKGVKALLQGLASGCPLLSSLDFTSNLLRSEGAYHVANYIGTYARCLTHLNLGSNQIGPDGGRSLAQVLSSGSCYSLRSLNLDMNQLEAPGCEEIGRMLSRNNTLVELNIARNNIFDDGCRALFRGLHNNISLEYLEIPGNFITPVGVEAIRDYLLRFDTKERRANARAASAEDLADVQSIVSFGLPRKQAENTYFLREEAYKYGLLSLNLSSNALRNDGLDMICEGLRVNPRLLYLNINHTEITDIGIGMLRQLLEETSNRRTGLISLSLRHNYHLTKRGYNALGRGCKASRHILQVNADLPYDSWRSSLHKIECVVTRNVIFAIDRYSVPLGIVGLGRVLLNARAADPNSTSIAILPMDIRELILLELDRHRVLSPEQKRKAIGIAYNIKIKFASKLEMLKEILGPDYPHVYHTIKMLSNTNEKDQKIHDL